MPDVLPSFPYPAQAVLIPVSSLDFGERTRTDYPNLQELADSISLGLIHPPTINTSNQLIAGGRRCRAMIDVLKLTHIPVVYLETLDEAHLRMLEDQENYQRVTPPWQDRVRGIHRVHTAEVVAERLDHRRHWTVKMTGDLFNLSQASVSNALALIPHILSNDKEIMECATPADAMRVLLARREKEVQASLVSSLPTLPALTSTAPSSKTS